MDTARKVATGGWRRERRSAARAGNRVLGLHPLGALLVTTALVAIFFGSTQIERSGPISAAVIVPMLAGLAGAPASWLMSAGYGLRWCRRRSFNSRSATVPR